LIGQFLDCRGDSVQDFTNANNFEDLLQSYCCFSMPEPSRQTRKNPRNRPSRKRCQAGPVEAGERGHRSEYDNLR